MEQWLEGERQGPYLFDASGKRYLDCYGSAGTFNLGRRPPEVVEEMRRAMRETDQGNFPMISREKAALAQALARLAPGQLECCVLSVMRGETVELACKLARGATGRPGLLAAEGGWHGQTGFALTLSQRPDRQDFAPLIPEVGFFALGNLEAAERAITSRTAAVILEPIQAENHCREATVPFVEGLARCCRERGVVLVFDETQTGLGRTGSRFAAERLSVVPDVLVIGEALGAGIFPIAATLFTQRLNRFLNAHPLIHLSTFGGSDLGCRVALKALELYEREHPWDNAAARGEQLLAGLSRLAERHSDRLRSVAGRGLLLSLDLSTADGALRFCRSAADHGLFCVPALVARNAVPLRPSLLIDAEQAAAIVTGVEAALRDMA